jgi:DNA repair protein RadC
VAQNPVERVRNSGVHAATTIDLLAVAFSRREADAAQGEQMARDILARIGKIQALGEISLADIHELSGLEDFEALRCQALLVLGRRTGVAGKGSSNTITCKEDVEELLDYLRNEKREHFCVVLLDSKCKVMRTTTVHVGTLTMSVVGPREVFREAIREGASSIIVAHNHPSGDPTPSPEDIQVTKKLVELGKELDIHVLDHVILGYQTSVSLADRGLIK